MNLSKLLALGVGCNLGRYPPEEGVAGTNANACSVSRLCMCMCSERPSVEKHNKTADNI